MIPHVTTLDLVVQAAEDATRRRLEEGRQDRVDEGCAPGGEEQSGEAERESHVPERIEGRVPALQGAPSVAPDIVLDRPLRTLDPPEEVRVIYAVPEGPPAQFRWRGVLYQSTRHAGPERIAPEWWREKSTVRLRDYYRIEDNAGRRYWIYRHGLIGDGRGNDRQGGLPDWYLQGLCA